MIMSSYLASGISGMCFIRIRDTTMRSARTYHKDAPLPREVQAVGRVLPVPILGGLHHQYVRV